MSKIVLTDEATTPATPAAGKAVVYAQGGALKVLTSAGATTLAPATLGTAGQVLTEIGRAHV